MLLPLEVVGDELLDSGNTSETSDEDELVDFGLVNLRISKDMIIISSDGRIFGFGYTIIVVLTMIFLLLNIARILGVVPIAVWNGVKVAIVTKGFVYTTWPDHL